MAWDTLTYGMGEEEKEAFRREWHEARLGDMEATLDEAEESALSRAASEAGIAGERGEEG